MTWCWLWLFNCCRGLGDCEVHMWWRLVPRQGQTSHRQEQRQQDGAGSPLHRLRKLGDCGVGQVRRIGRDSFSYLVETKMMAVLTPHLFKEMISLIQRDMYCTFLLNSQLPKPELSQVWMTLQCLLNLWYCWENIKMLWSRVEIYLYM